ARVVPVEERERQPVEQTPGAVSLADHLTAHERGRTHADSIPGVAPDASSVLKPPRAHFIIASPSILRGDAMARIPLATRDQIADKEKSAYDAFMESRANRPNIGPYALLLHMPEMAHRLEALRTYLRDETSLPQKR